MLKTVGTVIYQIALQRKFKAKTHLFDANYSYAALDEFILSICVVTFNMILELLFKKKIILVRFFGHSVSFAFGSLTDHPLIFSLMYKMYIFRCERCIGSSTSTRDKTIL